MITTKKFKDTRTGEIVERFSILDIKFMQEVEYRICGCTGKEQLHTIENNGKFKITRCENCGEGFEL